MTVSDKTAAKPELTLSEETIADGLPKTIQIHGGVASTKVGKLFVLSSIYNAVAAAPMTEQGFDLQGVYKKVKSSVDDRFSHQIRPDSNTLMQAHRRPSIRNGLLSFLNGILKPKSTSFLEKTGFFAAAVRDANSKPNKDAPPSPVDI